MFDIGFSELCLIGIVALVVFGPEDLPRVARTVGHLLGKLRRYVSDVKSDINREMELADVKRIRDELKEGVLSVQNSLNSQARSLEADFQQSISGIQQDLSVNPDHGILAEPEPFELTSDAQPELVGLRAESAVDDSQLDLFGMPQSAARKD
jgi:sec-independent protein translocase protein TatB